MFESKIYLQICLLSLWKNIQIYLFWVIYFIKWEIMSCDWFFYCEVVSCGLDLPSILHCQGELVAMLGNKECLLKTIDDGNI